MRQHDAIITCPTCLGKGKTIDPDKQGQRLRKERKQAGISLRVLAAEMGFSHNYLSDLENGNRAMDAEKSHAYRAALANLTK